MLVVFLPEVILPREETDIGKTDSGIKSLEINVRDYLLVKRHAKFVKSNK